MSETSENAITTSLSKQLSRLQAEYPTNLTREEALKLALQCAELQMKFLKLASNPEQKVQLRETCKSLLDEAERIKTAETFSTRSSDLLIDLSSPKGSPARRSTSLPSRTADVTSSVKPQATHTRGSPVKKSAATDLDLNLPVSRRRLTKQEEILLLKASKLNGFTFPPWRDVPNLTEFELGTDGVPFCEDIDMALSPQQQEMFTGWKRPSEALPLSVNPTSKGQQNESPTAEVTMTPTGTNDLVQDAATDCSVVASLCAALARVIKGHQKISLDIFHPFDVDDDQALISPNGKYIIKAFFNGCFRKVVIDDRLPVSNSGRIMHVWDRNNPGLLWPALIEKAYLKVRGGYDFPGSNSGTDLWVITGWIPEQVFIEPNQIDLDRLWERIFNAFTFGDVIITMGTGAMTATSEKLTGLVGQHDYAVLDLAVRDGSRQLQVKNPWLQGTSWIGYNTDEQVNNSSKPGTSTPTTSQPDSAIEDARPGVFWMDINDVVQHFDSIYLNWNPALFKNRYDIHFSWDLSPGAFATRSTLGMFNRNPQYMMASATKAHVWIIVSKHFIDKEKDNSRSDGDCGYISLYAFQSQGCRVYLSKNPKQQVPYVDSPQTLLKVDLEPNTPQTIVLAEQNLPNFAHSFTLSAFSRTPLILEQVRELYTYKTATRAAWKNDSAGGNANAPTYARNPQFKLTLTKPTPLAILLETTSSLPVNVKLLHGQGQRLASITTRDIIADSGHYQQGAGLAQLPTPLAAGIYTVICSTYEAGQESDFVLHLESNDERARLEQLPKEGAGRLRTRFADASFGQGCATIAAPVTPKRLCRLYLTLVNVTGAVGSQPPAAPSPMRLSLELGRGPSRQFLISSTGGAFAAGSLRTDDVDLRPDMLKHGVWLVLQRMGDLARGEERVGVEMFADVPDAVEVGVWRQVDR